MPARLFEGFWYQAGTWEQPRRVVAKAEANEQGSQRRFVVTDRPGARLYPEASYDEYAARGESENRHKEFKCDLSGGRLSDHRFCANYFRLYLHALALNLVVLMRGLVALPEPQTEPAEVPREAATGDLRRRQFNQRRRRDVLGEAQPATWRQQVIKVAVRLISGTRRVVAQVCDGWPHLEQFRQFARRLLAALAAPPPTPQQI